jgi:hypothetical protein
MPSSFPTGPSRNSTSRAISGRAWRADRERLRCPAWAPVLGARLASASADAQAAVSAPEWPTSFLRGSTQALSAPGRGWSQRQPRPRRDRHEVPVCAATLALHLGLAPDRLALDADARRVEPLGRSRQTRADVDRKRPLALGAANQPTVVHHAASLEHGAREQARQRRNQGASATATDGSHPASFAAISPGRQTLGWQRAQAHPTLRGHLAQVTLHALPTLPDQARSLR